MEAARRTLRRSRYRVAEHDGELAGEKGFLREAASLLFHVSLLVLLVGLAYGKGYGYRGQAAIVEGETWANARVGYDSFSPGRFFGPERLAPFQLRLDDFTNSFHPDNTPREFASRLTALDLDGRELQSQRVAPNRPMTVDGVRIFQSDYGYVPVVELLGDRPLLLQPGQSRELANGMVVSFTDLKQYSVFTLARDPGVPVVAVAAGLLLLGLIPSLYVTRRRVWVRAAPDGAGGTRVELAGLALQGKAAFEQELARLAEQVRRGTLGPPERST
jgi:cytochrome c biogenesis protein